MIGHHRRDGAQPGDNSFVALVATPSHGDKAWDVVRALLLALSWRHVTVRAQPHSQLVAFVDVIDGPGRLHCAKHSKCHGE